MSNQSVQTVSTSNDKIKVALAIVVAIAGVMVFTTCRTNQLWYAQAHLWLVWLLPFDLVDFVDWP
jgi:energy-converting hydrogenase Eha subunit H